LRALAIYCGPGDGRRLRSAAFGRCDHAFLDARDIAAGLHPHRGAKGASERASIIHHALKNAICLSSRDRIEAAFLIGGLIVTGTVFNIPASPVSGGSHPLARLSDRPESRNADRRGSSWSPTSRSTCSTRMVDPRIPLYGFRRPLGRDQLRYRTCGAPVLIHPCWRKLTFLAQRLHACTAGLIIMVMFVLAAALADVICRFSPLAVDSVQR